MRFFNKNDYIFLNLQKNWKNMEKFRSYQK